MNVLDGLLKSNIDVIFRSMFKISLFILILALVQIVHADAFEIPEFTNKHVNDYADIISPEDEMEIERQLVQIFQENNINFFIVTNEQSDKPDNKHEYLTFTARINKEWGLNNIQGDKFLLLVISKEDRQATYIYKSESAEEYDDYINTVIKEHINPALQNNNYHEAVVIGTQKIISEFDSGVNNLKNKIFIFSSNKFVIIGTFGVIFLYLSSNGLIGGIQGYRRDDDYFDDYDD